jgi:hypothetical protein
VLANAVPILGYHQELGKSVVSGEFEGVHWFFALREVANCDAWSRPCDTAARVDGGREGP